MQSIRATFLASAAASLLLVAAVQQASAVSTRSHTGVHPLHHHPSTVRIITSNRVYITPSTVRIITSSRSREKIGASARDCPQSSIDLTDAAAKGRPFSFRQ